MKFKTAQVVLKNNFYVFFDWENFILNIIKLCNFQLGVQLN